MHGVNLDLLRTASSRHGEEHAHHHTAHLEALAEERERSRAAWLLRIRLLLVRLMATGRWRHRRTGTEGF